MKGLIQVKIKKRQITIPEEVLKNLDLKDGDEVVFANNNNQSYTIFNSSNLNLLEKKKTESKILSLDEITERVSSVLKNKPVNRCVLFGSYARGEATPTSDVDLVIDTKITGLHFLGLGVDIEEALGKKIDLLTPEQVNNYKPLRGRVKKEGIVIYGDEPKG